MTMRTFIRVAFATIACTVILLLTEFSAEALASLPGPTKLEVVDPPAVVSIAQGVPIDRSASIVHYTRGPSALDTAAQFAILLFSFGGLAAFVSFEVPRRKISAAAIACGTSAFIGLGILGWSFAALARAPRIDIAALLAVVAALFGAGVSWMVTTRRPNKSLERARER